MQNSRKVWLEKHMEKRAQRFKWSEVPALVLAGVWFGVVMYLWLL